MPQACRRQEEHRTTTASLSLRLSALRAPFCCISTLSCNAFVPPVEGRIGPSMGTAGSAASSASKQGVYRGEDTCSIVSRLPGRALPAALWGLTGQPDCVGPLQLLVPMQDAGLGCGRCYLGHGLKQLACYQQSRLESLHLWSKQSVHAACSSAGRAFRVHQALPWPQPQGACRQAAIKPRLASHFGTE